MRGLERNSQLPVVARGPISLVFLCLAACSTGEGGPQAASVTVFEGARLIVGDGSAPIEDGVFIVENGWFTQVGSRGQLEVPEGATRVDLTDKTVMPAIVNAHMHLSGTREELISQLEHNAYYGAGAVVSLGTDSSAASFALRYAPVPGATRLLTAGRGITRPEPGRTDAFRGVAVDLSWLGGTIPSAELAEMQAASMDRTAAQRSFGIQARNLAHLKEAGMRIAFGTDGGSPWAAHLEMEDMVAARMMPAEVIVAATRTSAELMGLEDMGTVVAGRSADFIVLDANPLDDVTNTRRISAVHPRGVEGDREGISARLLGPAMQ